MELTSQHEELKRSAIKFVDTEINPYVDQWEQDEIFPAHEVFKKLGELGMLGVLVPVKYGGSGLSYDEYVVVVSEIAKICGSVGLSVAAHNSLCTNHIYEFGNEEQRERWLPKLASGEWIGAWGITEHNTGSDAGGMATTAVKEGEHWVLKRHHNMRLCS